MDNQVCSSQNTEEKVSYLGYCDQEAEACDEIRFVGVFHIHSQPIIINLKLKCYALVKVSLNVQQQDH